MYKYILLYVIYYIDTWCVFQYSLIMFYINSSYMWIIRFKYIYFNVNYLHPLYFISKRSSS